MPGFVVMVDDLKAKGVDTIACVSVNDSWVMHAWAEDQNAGDIQMVADGNAEFAKAMGLEMDGSSFGLGTRSQRYAAIIEDGVVKKLLVDPVLESMPAAPRMSSPTSDLASAVRRASTARLTPPKLRAESDG